MQKAIAIATAFNRTVILRKQSYHRAKTNVLFSIMRHLPRRLGSNGLSSIAMGYLTALTTDYTIIVGS